MTNPIISDKYSTSTQEKLYNMYLELLEAEQTKKDLVGAANDNIKRIKAEMKELVQREEEADVVGLEDKKDALLENRE